MKKFLLISLLLLIALPALAIPQKIYIQGILKDANDNKLDGTYDIVFKIYSTATGGTALWQETQSNVQVDKGLYTVVLGSNTSFPTGLFSNDNLYVGIQVGSDPEMSPRIQMLSVPFAFNADTLDGYQASDFIGAGGMTTAAADARYVNVIGDEMTGILTNSANVKANQFISTVGTGTSPLVVSSQTLCTDLNADMLDGHHASDFALTTGNYVLFGPNQQQSTTEPFAVWVKSSAVYGVGISSEASNFGGIGVSGLATGSGVNYGGYFESASTAGSGVAGVYGLASNTGVAINYGGYFKSNGQAGTGVMGEGVTGVMGRSLKPGAIGVVGYATPESGAQSWGGLFIATSSNGYGVLGMAESLSGTNYGGYFESKSDNGRGIYGIAQSSTGYTYGGYFYNRSPNGIGARGVNVATSGNAYGGSFQTESTTGRAVYGYAPQPFGTNYGGYFEAGGITAQAVYGYASNNSSGSKNYGGYFLARGENGTGVYGKANNTGNYINYGGSFEAYGQQGRGVYGVAPNSSGAVNYGGYFESSGTNGIGVYGKTNSSSGFGVKGVAAITSVYGYLGSQNKYGVHGYSNASNGAGVYGYDTGSSLGAVYGLSTTGIGVHGLADGPAISNLINYGGYFEADGEQGLGVCGIASNTSSFDRNYGGSFEARAAYGIGVSGISSHTSNVGWAGFFLGGQGVYIEKDLQVKHLYDNTTASSANVYVNSNGWLFRSTSSRKYKENIKVFETDFSKILEAKPKSFTCKTTGDQNIGYIAEEFDELGLKELVVYKDGEPDALKYDRISLYLLEIIKDQQKEIGELKAKLSGLESKLATVLESIENTAENKSEQLTVNKN